MPAEKIHPRPQHPDEETGHHVRVGWGTDFGDVQIASLFPPKRGAEVIIDTVNDWLKAAGLQQIPGREELQKLIMERSDPDSLAAQFGVNFEGFHVTLSERHDVNRTIALLKRARDGAFGRDE